MKIASFLKNGGLLKLSHNVFVSIFSLAALVLAFVCDFSIYTALVFAGILVHEISHVVFARLFGARIIRTVVYPFGVDMICDTSRLPFVKEFVIVMCGGLSNIAFALVFWRLFCVYDAKWLLFFCCCNAFLGIANLIPISTFDGGRAFSLLLSMVFLPDKVYVIQKYTDIVCLCFSGVITFCFLDVCGFNLSLLASMVYCIVSSALFGLYKKRYI